MERIGRTLKKLKNPEYARRFVSKNWTTIQLYFLLFVAVLLVYHFLSDGDFSFLLTLGAIVTMFSFGIVLFKIVGTGRFDGVSLKTMQLYAAVFAARCCSILVYDGYLPYDSSGDWLYQTTEVGSFVLVAVIIVLGMTKFTGSYEKRHDSFTVASLPSQLGALVLFVPAAILAALVHPSLNQNFFTDTAWTLAMYLEGVAALPQLIMFFRKGGEVEAFTAHFVFGLGIGRVLNFLFWASSFHELNDRYVKTELSGGWFVGYVVLASQIVQILLMGDFTFYYLRSVTRGGPMILPGHH